MQYPPPPEQHTERVQISQGHAANGFSTAPSLIALSAVRCLASKINFSSETVLLRGLYGLTQVCTCQLNFALNLTL